MKYNVDMEYDYKSTNEKQASEKSNNKSIKFNLIVFVVLAVILNLLAIIYIKSTRNIFFWSNADYWNMARSIARGDYGNKLFEAVYNSIIKDEFNMVPALIPAIFARYFGESRMVYVLSIVNCYLLPSSIIIYMLAKRIGKAPVITTAIALFTAPALVYLTFNGFTEMGGFTLSLLCFYLYFRKEKLNVFDYIAIGLVLALLIIWNNWFVFYSVSFLTAMLAYAIIFKKKAYMSLITLATIIVIEGIFNGFIFQRLVLEYGVGNFNFNVWTNIKFLTRYIGLIFIIIMIVSSVNMAKKSEKKFVFAWIQILICYITFTSTRTHGQGHIVMYMPALLFILILTVKHITKEKVLIGVVALAILNTLSVFVPRTQPQSISEIKYTSLFPTFSVKAKVRDSYQEILALKRSLDRVVPEGEYLGVLSYSDIMNNEILKNVEPSLNIKQKRVGYIANTIPYFDLPETNIEPLCNANYMLVAYPAQMVRVDQKIIEAAVDSFENWSDIATAYEEVYEYATVIDGVTLKLYHRTRAVSEFEKAQFKQKYINMLNN